MANRIVEITTDDNSKIYIETDLSPAQERVIAAKGTDMIQATNKFEESLEPIVNLSKTVLKKITDLSVDRPDEVELSFSIKLSGKLDFWVISGNGEGNISLSLKWKK